MAFDEALADRLRIVLSDTPDVLERKMFGGLAFLLRGKMFCGIVGKDLMVRVGPQNYGSALDKPHARPMDFTGRPMVGYVYVGPRGCASVRTLGAWIKQALAYVEDLPERSPRPRRRVPTTVATKAKPRRPKPPRAQDPTPARPEPRRKPKKGPGRLR